MAITSRKNHSLSLAAIEGQIVPESETYVGKLRAAALSAVAPDDVAEVVKEIVAKAKTGDRKAQALLLSTIVGVNHQKPSQINVTIECPDTESAARAAQELRQKGARHTG